MVSLHVYRGRVYGVYINYYVVFILYIIIIITVGIRERIPIAHFERQLTSGGISLMALQERSSSLRALILHREVGNWSRQLSLRERDTNF